MGTRGRLFFQDALMHGHARFYSFEFCGTLVPWYILNADMWIRPINVVPDDDVCSKWIDYAAIAAEGGCIANVTHAQRNVQPWAPRWPDHASYLRQVVPNTLLASSSQMQRFQDAIKSETQREILVTFAQTAKFDWRISSHDTRAGIQPLSSDGGKVGEVALPLEDCSQYSQLTHEWEETLEIMGLSLAILTAPGNDSVAASDRSVYVDGQEFPDTPVVNVLVIERSVEFVKRKYLGWVCLDDWIRAERTWEHLLFV